jgi:hypothetical protein
MRPTSHRAYSLSVPFGRGLPRLTVLDISDEDGRSVVKKRLLRGARMLDKC